MTWYYAATAAMPYAEALEQGLVSTANGRVRFREGKSGTIYLACPITEPEISAVHLRLTFQDAIPAGKATDTRVAATLKRISKSTGNISNITAISSDSYPGTAAGAIVNAKSVRFAGSAWNNFYQYYYYIIITLWRKPTSQQNPVAYGVGLEAGV